MRAWLVMIVLAACGSAKDRAPDGDPWSRCAAVTRQRLADTGSLDAVVACRDLFRPACARAMRIAEPGMTLDDGRAILAACAKAYCPLPDQPMCGGQPTVRDAKAGADALLRAALADVRGATDDDRRAVAMMLAQELMPAKARIARITIDGDRAHVELDGGGAWDVPAHASEGDFAPFVAAVIAADADLGGLLVKGSAGLAPDARTALEAALSRASITFVTCTTDGRNCR